VSLTQEALQRRNAERAAEGKPPLKQKVSDGRGPGRPPKDEPPPSRPEPPPDEAPKTRRAGGRTTKVERRAADLKLIEAGFTELLIDTPAMIGGMTGDKWLVQHTMITGPTTVARIVAEAERSDRFREIAKKAVSGQSIAMLVIALGSYLVPIGAHYGIIPGAEQMGVPRKSFRIGSGSGPEYQPPFRPPPGNGQPPESAPAEGPTVAAEGPPIEPI
jgi:hypothetical protein